MMPPAYAETVPEGSISAQATTTATEDAYIKGFLERYNNFNNLMTGKK